MNTMLRWSPTRQFHFHQDADNLFERFVGRATDEADQGSSWLPAAEGWLEDGTYVIQLALPGVDPKDVKVSWMDNVLTVKGESRADHDATGKDYFVRERGRSRGEIRERHTRGEGPRATSCDADDDRSKRRLVAPGETEPCRYRPARARSPRAHPIGCNRTYAPSGFISARPAVSAAGPGASDGPGRSAAHRRRSSRGPDALRRSRPLPGLR
jgi:HSP20 family molecular chaperone IbpA